jgi:hypothetical protein
MKMVSGYSITLTRLYRWSKVLKAAKAEVQS